MYSLLWYLPVDASEVGRFSGKGLVPLVGERSGVPKLKMDAVPVGVPGI